MGTGRPPLFGDLLRRHRQAAGLSQEALAEAARLSTRAISDLERGVRQVPRRDTVALLADALGLQGAERAALEAAVARRRGPRMPAQHTGQALGGAGPQAWSLPVPPTPFIGEAGLVTRLAGLLHGGADGRPSARMLTLTGPGGVGKTRLALELATEAREAFPDGVAFVPLAAVRDPSLVLPTIAQALGVPESAGPSVGQAVTAFLAPRTMLLVLDNFEQITGAAGVVADLLAACPRVAVVVTSRVPLHIRAEQVIPVAPLAVPDPRHTLPPDDLEHVPAAALFLARVRASDPAFVLTPAAAVAVSAICRQLDGLPLALELAAARARLLPPAAMAARLTSRLTLLSGGARDLPARQQTLRATLDWSYSLLAAQEQAFFRRLAVFAGGWTVEAAAAVAGAADDPRPDPLTLLESLEENSLVHHEEQADGSLRLLMLETVREYAGEQLTASGEAAATCERHVRFYLALAERAEPELRGPQQELWLDRLEAEHANLRAALAWAAGQGGKWGVRLAAALWRFWYVRGHQSEGRRWLEELLAAGAAGAPSAARGRALHGAAALAEAQGDYPRALALCDEEYSLWTALEDRAGMAGSLNTQGNVAMSQGHLDRAWAAYEGALSLWREAGDTRGVAAALNNLGVVARLRGEADRAADLSGQSLALRRQIGDTGGVAFALDNLGTVARLRGEAPRAAALYAEALGLWRALGDRWGIATVLAHQGGLRLEQGDAAGAAAAFVESLAASRDTGDRAGIVAGLEGLAATALAGERHEAAARLLGAAAALREVLGTLLPPAESALLERQCAALRGALSEPAFAAAWAAGYALPLAQAIAEALEAAR